MAEVDARKLLAQAKVLSARYARRLGPDEAADLASEAVARGLECPPADGRMDPWIERIARNLLVDRWRRSEVAARAPADAGEVAPSPEELVLAGERRRVVRGSLARLPRDQRRSVLRRYYGGTVNEGTPAATLRTRLHRGLARLRDLTRGMLAVVPPLRILKVLPLALNPAAAVVFLVAQQAPLPSPVAAVPLLAQSQPRAAAPARPAPPAVIAPAPVVVVVAPAPARLAPAPKAAPALAPTHYDFDDDQVEGEIQRPDGEPQASILKTKHQSLIEIPGSFVPAAMKSIEDL